MLSFATVRPTTVDDCVKFIGGIRNIRDALIFDEKTIDGYTLDEYYKKITEETGIHIVYPSAQVSSDIPLVCK